MPLCPFREDDALRALSWLHRPARGLGGVAPATLLTTQMGVQAVIDLVGRIQHGVLHINNKSGAVRIKPAQLVKT